MGHHPDRWLDWLAALVVAWFATGCHFVVHAAFFLAGGFFASRSGFFFQIPKEALGIFEPT